MDLYEILLQRIVLLTDEYLQLKERVKVGERDKNKELNGSKDNKDENRESKIS